MTHCQNNNFGVKESLEAAEYIAARSQHVKINNKSVVYMACNVIQFWEDNQQIHLNALTNIFSRPESYPDFGDKEMVDWLFVFHTLNFSLFNSKGIKQWTAGCNSGYCALAFAINRAINEGKPLWDPKYYTTLTQSELKHIFRSDDGETSIPRIRKRRMILHNVGNTLLKKYKGTFVECVKSSDYDANELVKLLFDEFESYRDEAIYDGTKVRLYTKAKSLVSDIWAYYRNNDEFYLDNGDMMSTMFIDYRAPIVLYHFKVLVYSPKLVKTFNESNVPLLDGSREELEIRACSLVAANRMLKFIEARWREADDVDPTLHCASILIDNFLLGYLADKFHKYIIILKMLTYV